MPNIAKILKDEIQRLAKKEINQAISGVRKSNATLRKIVAEHKRRIATLEQGNRKLTVRQVRLQRQAQPTITDREVEDTRFTAKSIKSLRRRLGISQFNLSKLLGASINIVTIWEKKQGRIKIRRPEVRAAFVELKGMKKVEVQERLGKSKSVSKKTGKAVQKKKIVAAAKPIRSKITANMIKDARKKLGISQPGLARLVGVSYQVVSVWEKKSGKLGFRNAKTEGALLAVMKFTKNQAQRRLARKK